MPKIIGRIAVVIGIGIIVLAGTAGQRFQETLSAHLEYTVPFTVYYGTLDGSGLIGVKKSLPKWEWSEFEVLRTLAAGPGNGGRFHSLVQVLPDGAEPQSLELVEGTATVDFNSALVRGHSGGTAGEVITVYSIVNTLTELPGIDRVRITVEGKSIDTISGHLDLSVPLERDESLILNPSGR